MLRWPLVFGSSLALVGCLCSDPVAVGDAPVVLTPLPAFELDLPKGRSLDVPVNATDRRPFVLVLTDHSSTGESGSCTDWFRRLREGRFFVLCDETNELGDELRAILKSLKQAAPAHLGRPPITVIVDRRDALPALELVSREPSFFAHVAFVEPADAGLSLVWLSAFAVNGGRRLLVTTKSDEVRARVLSASRPGGVVATVLPPGESARAAVMDFVRSADSRSVGELAVPTTERPPSDSKEKR